MTQLDLSQDTIRQRRNLVVTSLLLIFIELADVSFGSEVSFLGATLNIGKPEVLHRGLLVFQTYFLWRFYQYFSTDKAYGALRNQHREYMKRYTTIKIVQLICKPRQLSGLSGEYLYEKLSRKGLFTYSIEAAVSKGEEFIAEISAIKLEASRLLARLGFVFRARILTDYFVPYLVVVCAVYLQFV